MAADIPVVIAHFGNQPDYLKCALEAAVKWNTTVVLLGDDHNKELWPHHFSATGINIPKWQDFQKVYIKFSNYPDFYEYTFWFRMFFLEFWMHREGHQFAFLLDSDSLTFANYSQELQSILEGRYIAGLVTSKEPDNRLLWYSSPHFSYWTLAAISDFTNFCIDAYRNQDYLEKFRNFFQMLNAGLGGNVSEMTLLSEWSKNKAEGQVFNFAKVFNNMTFDRSIQLALNYEENEYVTRYGVKKFEFRDGQPYCYNRLIQKHIRFLGIQCSGGYKYVMRYLMSPVGRRLYLWEVGLRKARNRFRKKLASYFRD